MTQPLIFLGLNEVNFDYVKTYSDQGHLPNFKKLFDTTSIIQTSSEKEYHELEPWIQWVSIQTGKTFAEHGIFRLGDVTDQDMVQIWEHLESTYGTKVAAISPMNAANNTKDPAFFIPDPWTKTGVVGNWLMRGLSDAVSNAVNENATGGNKLSTYIYVLLGVLRYSLIKRHIGVIVQILKSLKTHYQRAILLDQLLTDMFIAEWSKDRPGFSSLFLNSCAHLQHHYLFNASVYNGPNKNPDWYIAAEKDPVLEGYKNYDQLLGQIMNLPGKPRVMIATGLHQNPVENPVFYWRLKDHGAFLEELGVSYKDVQPRMSRDFLVEFESKEETDRAQQALELCTDEDGKPMFGEIENRKASLFVSLTYPHDIPDGFVMKAGNKTIENIRDKVGFVALKNGEHDGEGYLVDSANSIQAHEALPITKIYNLIDQHFSNIQSKKKAT